MIPEKGGMLQDNAAICEIMDEISVDAICKSVFTETYLFAYSIILRYLFVTCPDSKGLWVAHEHKGKENKNYNNCSVGQTTASFENATAEECKFLQALYLLSIKTVLMKKQEWGVGEKVWGKASARGQ